MDSHETESQARHEVFRFFFMLPTKIQLMDIVEAIHTLLPFGLSYKPIVLKLNIWNGYLHMGNMKWQVDCSKTIVLQIYRPCVGATI